MHERQTKGGKKETSTKETTGNHPKLEESNSLAKEDQAPQNESEKTVEENEESEKTLETQNIEIRRSLRQGRGRNEKTDEVFYYG